MSIEGDYTVKPHECQGCGARLSKAIGHGLRFLVVFAVGFVGGCVFGQGL